MARSETLETLNRRFRSVCRILLKEEIGDVWEYDEWLSEMIDGNRHEKSCVSGKDVALGIKEYARGARFLSLDEIDFGRKREALSINDIKGIDSLVEALRERFAYAGNLVIGKCSHVERSANISDSHYVYDSAQYGDSKYIYKCTVGRVSEDMYGIHGPGESKMCIRCTQLYRNNRCFEAWMCQNCSDVYYSFNLDYCQECFFCFNLRNRRHCIGNVQLDAKSYAKAKARLLSEIADKLKAEKSLPSLMDIVEKSRPQPPKLPPLKAIDRGGGMAEVEREFSKTSKLVLGKELCGIRDYQEWLSKHTHKTRPVKSALSGKRMLFLPYILANPEIPQDRVIAVEEADWMGEYSALEKGEAEGITVANAHERIGGIAFFPIEFYEGKNACLTDCSMSIHTSYCYLTAGMVESKYCACGMWPRNSERCFGFDTMWSSSFCMKCFHSVSLTRCFECDSCHSCSDCHYCHNCENCRDCLFCFNAKNLRYAIGNAEYPREEYVQMKNRLLAEIAARIEKDKKLGLSIYSIGAKG